MSTSDTPLVEQLRAIGITMGSLAGNWHIGYTTSAKKVLAAEELGAKVRPYTSADKTFDGWEIITSREPNEGSKA